MSIPAQGAVGAETMTAGRIAHDAAYGLKPDSQLWQGQTEGVREFWNRAGAAVVSALASPRADSDERTAGEDLNDRLRAAGMFTIPEMMGETPLTRWEVHAAMKSLDAFGWWLDAQVRQYLHLKARYDLGDKDESDELYEWTLAHVGAFRAILVNFKAARKATPAQPAGAVPDSLRALDGTDEAVFACACARWVRTLLATHPAGQSAGSGAGCPECFGSGLRDIDGTSDDKCAACAGSGVPAPDSTRTGPVGSEEAIIAALVEYGAAEFRAGMRTNDEDSEYGAKENAEAAERRQTALSAINAALAARPAAPEAQGAWRWTARDGHPIRNGEFGEQWLLAWSEASATYDVACIDNDWPHGEPIKLLCVDAWKWIEASPGEPPAPPASSGQGGR